MNDSDGVIDAVDNASNPVDQALEAEVRIVNQASTLTRNLGKVPAYGDPQVDHEEAQGHQHKAQNGIRRGRPAPGMTSTPIAGFDTETATVGLPHLLGGEGTPNHDEDHPLGPTFVTTRAASGSEDLAYGQVGSELTMLWTVERVARAVAAAPMA